MDTDSHSSMHSPSPTRPVLKRFDWTSYESASVAVIEAIADASNEEVIDLPPLYEMVDPDALDRLVTDDPYSPTPGQVDVSFTFDGYLVRITSAGDGYICPQEA
jgi:hypothetical protein